MIKKDRRVQRIVVRDEALLRRRVDQSATLVHAGVGRVAEDVIGTFHGTCEEDDTKSWTLPLGRRCVAPETMTTVLRLLLEGNGVRSLERTFRVHRDTIIANMVEAGEKCRAFSKETVRGLSVEDVQCDELWGFVGMKEKTRLRKDAPECFGDVWCFTAIERHTKLILAYHVGKRTPEDTATFAVKLAYSTRSHFQLTTDGFTPYRSVFPFVLWGGRRPDYATLTKVFGETDESSRRYSPPEVIGTIERVNYGSARP